MIAFIASKTADTSRLINICIPELRVSDKFCSIIQIHTCTRRNFRLQEILPSAGGRSFEKRKNSRGKQHSKITQTKSHA